MRKSYPRTEQSLLEVVPLTSYVEKAFFQKKSPFLGKGVLDTFLMSTLISLVQRLESFAQKDFYVENTDRELFDFSKPVRLLIAKLLLEKYILNWECGASLVGNKEVYVCQVTAGAVVEDTKTICPADMLNGSGSGATPTEALTIACAELIERWSCTDFREVSFRSASIEELRELRVHHYAHSCFKMLTKDEEQQKINWVLGTSLTSRSKVYLPASSAYLFYSWKYPQENIFLDLSSNGVAAYTNKEGAIVRAIYELLERDAFLQYWLHKITPQKIDPFSLPEGDLLDAVKLLKKRSITIHLLYCKTEFEVYTFVGVLVDEKTKAVHVDAAAGVCLDDVIRKILTDAVKWNPAVYTKFDRQIQHKYMTTIEERKSIWHEGALFNEIGFLISGEVLQYSTFNAKENSTTDALSHLLAQFKANNMEVYCYDFEYELARESGLVVMRVIVPELLPMYFVESMKPVYIDRLYQFPKIMNLQSERCTQADLNTIPHPFI